MCLSCQQNTFSSSKQSNSNLCLLNSGFHNFLFSSDTILSDEDLKSFFTECNPIETPFNDSDHPIAIDSKYCDINDFNNLKINENSSLKTLF